MNDPTINEGLDQILIIAKERTKVLENLKDALLKDDISLIKTFASEICGLNHENNRVFKSIDA